LFNRKLHDVTWPCFLL